MFKTYLQNTYNWEDDYIKRSKDYDLHNKTLKLVYESGYDDLMSMLKSTKLLI